MLRRNIALQRSRRGSLLFSRVYIGNPHLWIPGPLPLGSTASLRTRLRSPEVPRLRSVLTRDAGPPRCVLHATPHKREPVWGTVHIFALDEDLMDSVCACVRVCVCERARVCLCMGVCVPQWVWFVGIAAGVAASAARAGAGSSHVNRARRYVSLLLVLARKARREELYFLSLCFRWMCACPDVCIQHGFRMYPTRVAPRVSPFGQANALAAQKHHLARLPPHFRGVVRALHLSPKSRFGLPSAF